MKIKLIYFIETLTLSIIIGLTLLPTTIFYNKFLNNSLKVFVTIVFSYITIYIFKKGYKLLSRYLSIKMDIYLLLMVSCILVLTLLITQKLYFKDAKRNKPWGDNSLGKFYHYSNLYYWQKENKINIATISSKWRYSNLQNEYMTLGPYDTVYIYLKELTLDPLINPGNDSFKLKIEGNISMEIKDIEEFRSEVIGNFWNQIK